MAKTTPEQQKAYAERLKRGIYTPAKQRPEQTADKHKYKPLKSEQTKKKYNTPKEFAVETTLRISKAVQTQKGNSVAPRAMREIKRYARKFLGVSDVRMDPEVNKFIWSQGIRNPPRRIRVRFVRTQSDEEGRENKLVTRVYLVPVADFSGLITKPVESTEEATEQ